MLEALDKVFYLEDDKQIKDSLVGKIAGSHRSYHDFRQTRWESLGFFLTAARPSST